MLDSLCLFWSCRIRFYRLAAIRGGPTKQTTGSLSYLGSIADKSIGLLRDGACERLAELRELFCFSHLRQEMRYRILLVGAVDCRSVSSRRHTIAADMRRSTKFSYSADGYAQTGRHMPHQRALRLWRNARRRHGQCFSLELKVLCSPTIVAVRKDFGHEE